MKNLLLSICLIVSSLSFAQNQDSEVEYFQELFGMEKVQVAANLIKPSAAVQEAFWSTYDEYEDERRELGLQRIEALNKYAENYTKINADNVKDVVKISMELAASNNALIDKYYKKISKEVDPVAAAQFYQIEHYFLSEIRVAIFENIPLIGELKN